ncbi:hypothetical protein DR950_12780 [Kitasatospora xanthocidica]|uniref:DUF4097 domain-containing protein n=1 Tax=Kitasatospora xanthocidica TaxID=83382 RepID=A0A372ZRR3_9ACTN|nr:MULTISPECIES: DUF4097 family beta strand repeat-containing protein [Streptomycetaceae]OKI07698.1 hypothetical protein AMK13_14230 [Streptomyces sp. CB02056]RGD58543.1 hypothetical protein DR950_12780 [Kitasatospora xanthocidica]
MRQQSGRLASFVVLAAAVGGLSACGLAPDNNFDDDATVSDKITAVRLDTTSGGVTLRGKDGLDKVSVHRSVSYKNDKPGVTSRVENGVLVLGGCGQYCSVTYTVEVPPGLPVSGQTNSGSVNLTQVGNVQVSTHSGAVSLDGVNGTTEVKTTNGAITGRGLNGSRIQTETHNGAIDLVSTKPQDVSASTSNGAITLVVPSATYKVSAKTGNGHKDIGVSDDPSGRYQLDLSTSNGRIQVKQA